MNKKGFTLVEMLAVIGILAVLIILVVPSVTSINKNARKKMLQNKIDTSTQALILWAQDHKKCFIYGDNDCLGNCNINSKTCSMSVSELAEEGIIKYDEDNHVINPLDKTYLDSNVFTIVYNENTNSFSVTTNITIPN